MTAETKTITDDERAIIDELLNRFAIVQQRNPKMNEAACVREFIPFHSSVWSKLKSNSYLGNLETKIAQCRIALRSVNEYLSNAHEVTAGRTYHELEHYAAVRDALTVAKDSTNENRLIMFLAPSGGGKSELCRKLQADNAACIVEAKESWADSYFANLADVCASMRLRGLAKLTSKRLMEAEMLSSLAMRRHLLAFDEGSTSFGIHTANMIKMILNMTPTVVIVCSTPELLKRMMKTSEGMQLIRRCLAVIRAERITERDVLPFLPYKVEDAGLDKLVWAANAFGMYDTVTRVAATLACDHVKGDDITAREIEKAISLARLQVGMV